MSVPMFGPSPSEDTLSVAAFQGFDWDATPFAVVACEAEWCGHCKALKPDFEAAAARMRKVNPQVAFVELVLAYQPPHQDPDPLATRQFAEEAGVRGYPTILGYYKGDIIATYDGDRSEKSLVDFGLSLRAPPL
jgi:thiol-disulfide isomerase/thioredoxin